MQAEGRAKGQAKGHPQRMKLGVRLHHGPKKAAGKWHGQIKQAYQADGQRCVGCLGFRAWISGLGLLDFRLALRDWISGLDFRLGLGALISGSDFKPLFQSRIYFSMASSDTGHLIPGFPFAMGMWGYAAACLLGLPPSRAQACSVSPPRALT